MSKGRRLISGRGRTSLDSMAYSSEGSPTAHAHARRSRVDDGVGSLCQAVKDSVPRSMLAWLNDESEFSSEDAPTTGSPRHFRSAQAAVGAATWHSRTSQENAATVAIAKVMGAGIVPDRCDVDVATAGKGGEAPSVVGCPGVCPQDSSSGIKDCAWTRVGVRTRNEARLPHPESTPTAISPPSQHRCFGEIAMPLSFGEGSTAGPTAAFVQASGSSEGLAVTALAVNCCGSTTAGASARHRASSTTLANGATVARGGDHDYAEAEGTEMERLEQKPRAVPRSGDGTETQLRVTLGRRPEEGVNVGESDQSRVPGEIHEPSNGTTLSGAKARTQPTVSEPHLATMEGRADNRRHAAFPRRDTHTQFSVSPRHRRLRGTSRASPQSAPSSAAGSDGDVDSGEDGGGQGQGQEPTQRTPTAADQAPCRALRRNSRAARQGVGFGASPAAPSLMTTANPAARGAALSGAQEHISATEVRDGRGPDGGDFFGPASSLPTGFPEARGSLKRVASRRRGKNRSRLPVPTAIAVAATVCSTASSDAVGKTEPRSGAGSHGGGNGEDSTGASEPQVKLQPAAPDSRDLAKQERSDCPDRPSLPTAARDLMSSHDGGGGSSESPSVKSFVSFRSSSSVGDTEVNDFLQECTDDSRSGSAGLKSGGKLNACDSREVEDFFRNTSSSSPSPSSSESCAPRPSVASERRGGRDVRKTRSHRRGHRRRVPSPLSPALRKLPKEDQSFMKENVGLWTGLCAVSGLNFADLPPKQQLEMMKPMSTKRYKKGEVIVKAGDGCRRFYVVLGAPRELLGVGEVPAVSREASALNTDCRLLAGQFFGEKGLLRQTEYKRSSTMVAASTVVDVASIDIQDMDLWEPFRMFLILKEVPLLSSLSMPILDALQQAFRHQTYADGEYIVRQGEAGDVLYMIVRGTVDVIQAFSLPDTGETKEHELVQMFEGHYFGELALIYGEPRSASVRAKGEVRCVCIDKEDFRSCMNEKRFQEVVEDVAFQRARHLERRERQLILGKGKVHAATSPTIMYQQLYRGRGQRRGSGHRSLPSVSPCGSCGALDELGGDASTPIHDNSSGGRRRPGSGGRSSGAKGFRETAKVVKRKLENGTIIINKYEIVEEIGRGSYGSVHLCRDGDTGLHYAMKVVDKGRRGLRPWRQQSQGQQPLVETLRREVAVMKKLRHPNIVTLWEVIDDPKAHQLYMIQEYVDKGPLLPEGVMVQPLCIEDARRKFVGCVKGLLYLHRHGVVHGDIKPQNILVAADGAVKIADFGAAVVLHHQADGGENEGGKTTTTNPLTATPAFTPPELFGESITVSPASDAWAMGVTLYQMVHGTLPFWPKSGNHTELAVMVKHRELAFPPSPGPQGVADGGNRGHGGWGSTRGGSNGVKKGGDDAEGWEIPSEGGGSVVPSALEPHDPMVGYLRNLLRRLLEKDPIKRIGLRDAIKHPWVTLEWYLPLDELETAEDDSSGGESEVEVTDGELLQAWKTFPHQASPSPGSCSSHASCASSRRSMVAGFFPQQPEYSGSGSSYNGVDRTPVTTTPPKNSQFPNRRVSAIGGMGTFSPLQSPCCPTTQLTPSMVGNLNRFGWRSGVAGVGGIGHERRGSELSELGARREEPKAPSAWLPTVSPPGPSSGGRARALPRHLSIETAHHASRGGAGYLAAAAAGSPFASASYLSTPDTNVSATSDAVFFSGLRGAACFGLSPGTNEGSVAVVPGGAAGVSPSSVFSSGGRRIGRQGSALSCCLAKDDGIRQRRISRSLSFPRLHGDERGAMDDDQMHGVSFLALEATGIEEITLQRDITTSLVASPLRPRRGTSTSPATSTSDHGTSKSNSNPDITRASENGVVEEARTPRVNIFSPGRPDRHAAGPVGDVRPGTPPRPPVRAERYGWNTAPGLDAGGGLIRGRSAGSLSPPSSRLGLPGTTAAHRNPRRLATSTSTGSNLVAAPNSPPLAKSPTKSPRKPLTETASDSPPWPLPGAAAALGRSSSLGKEGGGWGGMAPRAFPAERLTGLRKGGDEGSGGDRERPARRLLPVDEAREMRASFERQKDFLVVSRNLAQDKSGRTNLKARLCIAGTKSSSFSVLRPTPTASRRSPSNVSQHRRASTSPTRLEASTWEAGSALGHDHARSDDAPKARGLGSSSSTITTTRALSKSRRAWAGASILPRCLSPSDEGESEDPKDGSGRRGGDVLMAKSPTNVNEDGDVVLTLPPPLTSSLGRGHQHREQPQLQQRWQLSNQEAKELDADLASIKRQMTAASIRSFLSNTTSDDDSDDDHNLPRGREGRSRGDGDKGPAHRASGEGVSITVDDEFVEPAGSFSSSDSDDLTAEEEQGWTDVVRVDPDSIEIALPTDSNATLADTDLLDFQPLAAEDLQAERVQARTWGDQVNLSLGLRYGHAAEIGSRRAQEDRTTAIGDMFRPRTPRYIGNRRVGVRATVSSFSLGGADYTENGPIPVPPPSPSSGSALIERDFGIGDASEASPVMAAAFFAVYDGHDGDEVAEALHQKFHDILAKQERFRDNVPAAIERACYEMDVACLEGQHQRRQSAANLFGDDAGSGHRKTKEGGDASIRDRLGGAVLNRACGATAVMAVVTRVGEETMIYASNVGDCRAVLCRGGVAIDLTSDHRFSRTDERTRIINAGGFVSRNRLNGILGVTRAFGDISYKEYPPPEPGTTGLWRGQQQLTAEPETNSISVVPEDDFLILACDGVWDVRSSQQAVSFVHRRLLQHRDVQRASRELCKTLGKRHGSDNCSCVVVCLNQVNVMTPVFRREKTAGREDQSPLLSAGGSGSEASLSSRAAWNREQEPDL